MMKYICRIYFSISKYLLQSVLLFFFILQTGCSNKSDITSNDKPGYQNPVSIFLLSDTSDQIKGNQEEWFYSIKDFSLITAQTRSLTPWPQAVRISDIAETENGAIVILINKKGVITVAGSASINDTAKITHESLANYTSEEIITNSNLVLCHVYNDTFFDNNFSVPLSPFVEIDIDNKKSIYRQNDYPAITNNFSLINLKKIDDKWFSAWKKSNDNGTIFKYFMHNSPLGENASEITESRFMLANQVLNNSNLPNNLKDFISNITKVEINNNFIIEVELRSKDNPVVTKYLLGTAGSDSSHYEKMCVSSEQGKYFISYKGEIYLIENGNLYCFSGVEKLPHNYNYTVLYASGDTLYAAWEQQRFFLTGACGLTLIDKKRVDKITQ